MLQRRLSHWARNSSTLGVYWATTFTRGRSHKNSWKVDAAEEAATATVQHHQQQLLSRPICLHDNFRHLGEQQELSHACRPLFKPPTLNHRSSSRIEILRRALIRALIGMYLHEGDRKTDHHIDEIVRQTWLAVLGLTRKENLSFLLCEI